MVHMDRHVIMQRCSGPGMTLGRVLVSLVYNRPSSLHKVLKRAEAIILCSSLMEELDPAVCCLESTVNFMYLYNGKFDLVI